MSSELSYKIDTSIINKRDYLTIVFPSFENLINFKYEIFGNKNFFLSGKIEKNSTNETRLVLEIPEDTIFLVKIIAFNKCKNNQDLFFKFINYDYRFNSDRNLTMEILKKNQINTNMNLSRLLSPDLSELTSIESLKTNLVDISNNLSDSSNENDSDTSNNNDQYDNDGELDTEDNQSANDNQQNHEISNTSSDSSNEDSDSSINDQSDTEDNDGNQQNNDISNTNIN
jgi:hypothetical protein